MEQRTHKCSGTPGSLVSSEVLLSGNFRLPGVAVDRQHNCGGLSEQRRGGGQVSNLVIHGNQAASVVCETTGVSDSQIRSRQTERTCRFALKEGADHSYRVDSPQGHSGSDFSLLGSPTHRSVCHETKQSTTDLCVSTSRPLSLGSGCDVPVLGGNVSVCIYSHPLLLKVLLKMEKETCLVILIAPCWESHQCFPVLLSLLVAPAIKLPCRRDLLIQPHSRLTHPKPEIFNLHAWLCCREVSRRQDFLKDLPRESVPLKELPHSLSTITTGTLEWIGVSNGKWIPSIHL